MNRRDDDAGPTHRAGREIGGDVVALRLVLRRPGLLVHAGELVGGDDVAREGGDQHDAHAPEQDGARQRRLAQGAQPLAVHVDVALAQEDLEVADHVGEYVAEQDDPAQRHHPLLADRRAPEPHEEVTVRARRRDGRTRVPGQDVGVVRAGVLCCGRDLFLHLGHAGNVPVTPSTARIVSVFSNARPGVQRKTRRGQVGPAVHVPG